MSAISDDKLEFISKLVFRLAKWGLIWYCEIE